MHQARAASRKPVHHPAYIRATVYEPLDQSWDKVEEAEKQHAEWISRGHSYEAISEGKR